MEVAMRGQRDGKDFFTVFLYNGHGKSPLLGMVVLHLLMEN